MLEADEGSKADGDVAEAEVFGARREPTVMQAQAVSKATKQHTAPRRLRDSHHRVARLAALGLRVPEIVKRSGYSSTRVYTLLDSPAFKELVARYRNEVDESWREAVDEFHHLATTNMLMAERQLNDKLHDADEIDEPLPTKDLVAITADRADRFGYGKNSTQLNLNVDFASQLERAIQRSGKVVEAVPAGLVPASSERRLEADQQAKPGPRRAPLLERLVPEGLVPTECASEGQSSTLTQPPTPPREGLRAVPAEAKAEVKRSPPIGIRRRI